MKESVPACIAFENALVDVIAISLPVIGLYCPGSPTCFMSARSLPRCVRDLNACVSFPLPPRSVAATEMSGLDS